MTIRSHSSAPSPHGRILLVCLLLLAALCAARAGLAELKTRWLEQEVVAAEAAASRGIDPSLALQSAHLGAPPARPDSAFQHELYARTMQLLIRPETAQRERIQLLRNARQQLRLAAAARPSWPYVWSELAALKAREGAFDAEFVNAFQRAITLGSNEPRVLQQLLGILFRYPDRTQALLDREGRVLVQNLGRRDPVRLFEQASRYHRAAWMCAGRDLDHGLAGVCTQRGVNPAD